MRSIAEGAVAVLLVAAAARAGTLDDMDLRSNVETGIRGTAGTATLHLKVSVNDAIASFEGRVRNLAQEDLVVDVASRVRGIRGVDRSGFVLEEGGAGNDALADAVARAILGVPELAASSIKVEANQGVVTLTGSIVSGAHRKMIRDVAGAIDGVADLVERLVTPAVPDEKIRRALELTFAPRATPRFPGRVEVEVDSGRVVLKGSVPSLYDKRVAERKTWEVNGVREVDNRVDLFSSSAIRVVHP